MNPKKITKEDLHNLIKKEIDIVKSDISNEHFGKIQSGDSAGVKMAKSQLYRTAKLAVMLHDRLECEDDLPAWMQAKITKACDYIQAAWNFVDYKTLNRTHSSIEDSELSSLKLTISESIKEALSKHTTSEDFEKWEEKAEKMSDAELLYSIKDAHAAAKALDKSDPISAGRYSDEAGTYNKELLKRRQR